MTVKISYSKDNPHPYKCARFNRCGYSSSHDGGYGGFTYHHGRLLCSDCVKFIHEMENAIYNG